MNNVKTLLALLLGTTLTACSSSPTAEQRITVEPIPYSQLCCTTLSEFPWIQLATNEELKFKINEDSEAAAFKDGNSYFSAFQLADRTAVATVRISSAMSNGEVFAPKLAILDEQLNIVSETSLDQFEIRVSDAFTQTRYSAEFKIDARKTPFFIIYTPEQYLGKEIQVDHPAKVRAKEFGEAMPMVTDPRYTHTFNGEIQLAVVSESYRPVKRNVAKVTPAQTQTHVQVKTIQPESVNFYHNAITKAVESNNIPKALSLLDEAKALGVKDAQKVFVEAVNAYKGK